MPPFAQTGMRSDAMYDFKNAKASYKSPVSALGMSTSGSMARVNTSNIQGGIAPTNPISSPRNSKSYATSTTPVPTSFIRTSEVMAPFGRTDASQDKASTSYSYCRPDLSDANSLTFQDLIKKGRKAQVDDERAVYETKKAKVEADRAKATRARLATDTAVRSLALESRSEIDTCKGKLINEMEKNLKALLESEFRAEIREKVYADEKIITATYEREIKDTTRLRLENDLEPVIVAELSAKHEEEVKQTLRAELESEVKEELRVKYKAEFEEELRAELEDTVRMELQELYREEVRIELKSELSPSVRAELIASLGLQHAVPELDDLGNRQPSYPDLGSMQQLNYNHDFLGYRGESQYDEEEGDEVFDDAPEQFGSCLVNNENDLNPLDDADHLEGGLVNADKLPNPVVDPNQPGCGSAHTVSQSLKRHIDEDYDESDEEEHSSVDRPTAKKVKVTLQYDVTAEPGSASANNINGDYQDEQARDDGAQYGEKEEDGDYLEDNVNVSAFRGGDRLQKDEEKNEDGGFPVLDGNSNACFGEEQLRNDRGEEEEGHFPPVDGNVDAYFGEEQPQDGKGPKEDRYFPDLNGNEETQYENFEDEEGGTAGYQDQALKPNAFGHEEERDSEEEASEEDEDEEDDAEDEEEEEEEDNEEDDEEDEEEDVGNNVIAHGCAEQPLGNQYRRRQINGADSFSSREMKHYRSDVDDGDLGDTGSASGRAQQPFGNHYGGTQINDAPIFFSRRMKHFRSEEEEEEEDDEAHDSKRLRGESHPTSEEGYSEVDSMEDEFESEGQDAQGGGNTYGLIRETNTQEDPYVVDSSDDEDSLQAVDEEKTLVDDGDFLSSKIETYVEESPFVEN